MAKGNRKKEKGGLLILSMQVSFQEPRSPEEGWRAGLEEQMEAAQHSNPGLHRGPAPAAQSPWLSSHYLGPDLGHSTANLLGLSTAASRHPSLRPPAYLLGTPPVPRLEDEHSPCKTDPLNFQGSMMQCKIMDSEAIETWVQNTHLSSLAV